MPDIHPSAVIHPDATIGDGCAIGPYCVIGGNVTLGAGNRLHSHVVIDGQTEVGSDNDFFPFASIGLKTQDLKWKGGTTWTRIGDRNTFRENVTVHRDPPGGVNWDLWSTSMKNDYKAKTGRVLAWRLRPEGVEILPRIQRNSIFE